MQFEVTNTDLYSYNNLKAEDKAKVDLIDDIKRIILSSDVIDDYLDEKDNISDTFCQISKETLYGFVLYLQERVEYIKTDMVIEAIDSYTDIEREAIADYSKVIPYSKKLKNRLKNAKNY